MKIFRRRRAAKTARDEGIALPMVIGIAAVMLLLVAVATSTSLSGVVKAKHDQDWNAAMAAAYAGVADFQSRLANDYEYVQYGNPDAQFSKTSVGTVVALPKEENAAFGIGKTGTWASVAESKGHASFRYEVDNSSYSKNGVLRIRSTGRVGTVARSVVADLKQQGFIDFLYFTDYEIKDPELNSTKCDDKYAWEKSRPESCMIQFVAGETLDGPIHSNDTMVMCGGTFSGNSTTSSNPTLKNGKRYVTTGCSSPAAPKFPITGGLDYGKQLGMPKTNSKMIQEVRTDVKAVQRPGCLYTGPTVITFLSNGQMNVRSPWTKETQIKGDPATSGTHPAVCGTPGNPAKSEAENAGTLSGATGQTFDVPDHNLAYVQGVSRTAGDPNVWATGKTPNQNEFKCVGVGDGTIAGNGLGFPRANEKAPAATASGVSYGCDVGDVFVSGTVNGAMTVAASHYVYITGNIKRQDPVNDILGLVGTGAVWVWNPVSCTTSWLGSDCKTLLTDKPRTIEAAILSVAHSFQVQNYDEGSDRGKLQVVGAIAQKFRGTVGTGGSGGTGYSKAYSYDTRMRNIAPPKFLSPVSTTYGVNVFVEVKSAFNADGTDVSP